VLGTIESSWTREGSKVDWQVLIPAGSRATLILPAAATERSVNGSTAPPTSPNGDFVLGSGAYEISFHLQ